MFFFSLLNITNIIVILYVRPESRLIEEIVKDIRAKLKTLQNATTAATSAASAAAGSSAAAAGATTVTIAC